MTPEEKKKTSDILTEKSVWVWIGLLPIHIKPLTLGQIYEMGEYTSQMEGKSLERDTKIIASSEMLARYKSAETMQEVFLICAFRRPWMRWMFRRYILNRLTIARFQKAIEVISNAYTANFFLTSIIFLHQTNVISEPSSMTARGEQSQE